MALVPEAILEKLEPMIYIYIVVESMASNRSRIHHNLITCTLAFRGTKA